jgi:hypothetical protein
MSHLLPSFPESVLINLLKVWLLGGVVMWDSLNRLLHGFIFLLHKDYLFHLNRLLNAFSLISLLL